MAKVETIATVSPLQFGPLQAIFFEDARTVAEMQNWVASRRPIHFLGLATGPDAWGGASTVASLNITFPAATGWNERLRCRIVVPLETQTIQFGVRCTFTGTDEGQVRITVGVAAAVTLATFTTANSGSEQTGSVATSASGTGEIDVIIEINHTLGSLTTNFVRDVRVEEAINTVTSLADPQDT